MNNKRLFEFLLLGIWLLLAVSVYTKPPSKIYPISSVKIKEPNLFEICVKGKTFSVTTESNNTPDKLEIVNLLKKVDSPGVVFLKKQENNVWLVEIFFRINGKKTKFKDCF